MTEHLRRISGRGVVFIIVAIAIVAYIVQPLLLPFVIAGVLAFVCTPLVNLIVSRIGIPRAVAAFVVFAVVVAGLGALGWIALPPLLREGLGVIENFEGIIRSAIAGTVGDEPFTMFGRTMTAETMAQEAVGSLRSWIGEPSRFLTVAGLGFASMIGLFITLVLFAYMIFDGPRIAEGAFWLVPPEQRPFARQLWGRLEPALLRYFAGLGVVVIYTSIAAYIGLEYFLGLPHAVLLAILTGFLELIPFIGPFAAALVAGMIAIQNAQGIGSIIDYAIYATALRLSIDQLVGPLVLGEAARIHPVMIIFCLLIGGYLFGPIGVLLAIPAAVTFRIVLDTLYQE